MKTFYQIMRDSHKFAESFKELIETWSNDRDEHGDPYLWQLLHDKRLFNELIESNQLTTDDLKYLLNNITIYQEICELGLYSKNLLKEILKTSLIDKDIEDNLYRIAEKHQGKPFLQYHNICNIFDLFEHFEMSIIKDSPHKAEKLKSFLDQELLRLVDFQRLTYTLNIDFEKRLELYAVIENDEIAKNRLIQIVDKHLENNYDFESLMNCLKKIEKKSVLNI